MTAEYSAAGRRKRGVLAGPYHAPECRDAESTNTGGKPGSEYLKLRECQLNAMTPKQKIKYLILRKLLIWIGEPISVEITAENIEKLYDEREDKWDAISEVSGGEVETGLPCEWSRHYESKAVAAKMPDGSWVGWTYWYGGGKHGEPESIDWISGAYALNCTEEQKMVTVQTFTREDADAKPA